MRCSADVNQAMGFAFRPDRTGESVTDSLSSQGITTYAFDAAQQLTTITTSYGGTAGRKLPLPMTTRAG